MSAVELKQSKPRISTIQSLFRAGTQNETHDSSGVMERTLYVSSDGPRKLFYLATS
jgi:hypothetical protein